MTPKTPGSPVFAFLFTHKRSGAVALFTNVENFADDGQDPGTFAARVAELDRTAAMKDVLGRDMSFLRGPGVVVGLGGSQTAEMLQALYAGCLSIAGLSECSVTHLGVVVGPGSFTGLRLGCAFGNGLLLGNPHRTAIPMKGSAGSVGSPSPSTGVLPESGSDPFNTGDPFSAPVDVGDIVACLENVGPDSSTGVTSFVPVYGREPGPVLKLRSEGGNV